MATILVVDDNAGNRELLAMVLGYTRHYVREAEDGEKALAIMRVEHFDLIVADLLMPNMDGYEFVLRLRSDPAFNQNLPRVVFWTAIYLEPEACMFANACGISQFISKPIKPESLAGVIDVALASEPLKPLGSSSEHQYLVDKHLKLVTNKLYRHIASLEEMVERRTSELKKSNTELRAVNRRLEDTHIQLLQVEKMASIGLLAAGVAHEINSPLSFVMSNMNSLDYYVKHLLLLIEAYESHEDILAKFPERLEKMVSIKQGAEWDVIKTDVVSLIAESNNSLMRVKNIVADLKDFSHVADTNWQVVDLAKELDSTLNIVHGELKHKAEIVKAYGLTPPVECLPLEINQVVMNLLINASQAMTGYGEITLGTGTVGDEVWIEVADNGSGIAPEIISRIFDPFFTTKPVGKGTGLGLSIAFSIVQKHCGRIEVTSELEKGTRFRVWLPIRHPVPKEILDEIER